MICEVCKLRVDTTGEYVEIVIPILRQFHIKCWRKMGGR